MILGIPREVAPKERRVAAVPETVARLLKAGFDVLVESGAGAQAEAQDAKYVEVGASIAPDAATVWAKADVIIKVVPPTDDEIALLRADCTLVSFVQPADDEARVQALAATGASVLGLDQVPRISRAQKLDALSAMANIAGYRAVIEAAGHFGRFFAGQMTAAGKVPPAKVLVIGGGVAGLAAITAAKGLGAVVRAFDTRLAVKEQVESLGAEFLMLDFEESGEGDGGYAKVMSDAFLEAERKLFADQAIDVDIIVTTANIPGREAPKLITSGMVESMKEGSVIVDLAAERGGNCQSTVPGETTRHHGVTIVGATDLPVQMPALSSRLLGNVHAAMLEELGAAEQFTIDLENEVVRGALIAHGGVVMWPPPKPEAPPQEKYAEDFGERPAAEVKPATEPAPAGGGNTVTIASLVAAAALVACIGLWAPASFVGHFTVFVLACFVGWQLVWNVTAALHTPLMSITNAVSGIIILGGLLHLGGHETTDSHSAAVWLGGVAVFFATVNIAGGFLVTRRMLAMFRK